LAGGDTLAVDEDAVGGVEVLNPLVLALADETAVVAGDGGVGDDEIAVGGATDNPSLDMGFNECGVLWVGWHRNASGTGNTLARGSRRRATNKFEILRIRWDLGDVGGK